MTEQQQPLTPEQLSPEVTERIANAPLPSDVTLRRRQNVPWQLLRFIRFNLRILGLVTREKLNEVKHR